MCQRILSDATFYAFQTKCDADLAAAARASGCDECGGRVDSAPYPRKPRGPANLPENYNSRFSFCCAREGCRKRKTPPSIRFLGRRVYLGAVVVLGTAMQQGVTPVRAQRLRELLGVSLRTLARWREWWRAVFAESAFWRDLKARFMSPVDAALLPLGALERLGADGRERLMTFLRLLAPLSTPAGYLPDQHL